LLCEAEINQLDVSLHINHHVIRLQIPINYVELVQVSQHHQKLCGVKLDPVFAALPTQFQIIFILEDPEEILAWQVLKNKAHKILVCKRRIQLDNKRIILQH
jgi:hypothetical protein